MSYMPRPDSERTTQDVEEIYAIAAEDLQHAQTADARRKAFRMALLRAYGAGVDAQRDLVQSYEHERPTPVPSMPVVDPQHEPDPGTIPTIKIKSWKPPQ